MIKTWFSTKYRFTKDKKGQFINNNYSDSFGEDESLDDYDESEEADPSKANKGKEQESSYETDGDLGFGE